MTLRERSWVSIGFLAITVLVAAMPAPAQCNSNDAGAPCFAGNPDILGGRTSLLQDDDLVVNTVVLNQVPAPTGANLLTSDSTITQTSPTQITAPNASNTALTNAITVRGRLFNIDHDQILSAVLVQNPSGQKIGAANLEGKDSSITVPSLLPGLNNAQMLYGASGNLLGGVYDQMVVVAANVSGQVVFQVVAAADPTNAASGLIVGPPSAPVATSANVFAVTTGVFADPQPDVPHPPAQIALISGSPGTTAGVVLTIYSVDSKLNVTPTGKSLNISLQQETFPFTIAIASGRFSGGTHDQLAIAYPVFPSGQTGAPGVSTVDFDAQGNPVEVTSTYTGLPFQYLTSVNPLYPAAIYLAKGKFNWFSLSDQLGISVGTDGALFNVDVGVISFDSSLNATVGPSYQVTSACHFGLAAGRFDSMQTNAGSPPAQVPNPNLQLADIATNCSGGPRNAMIYDVDPTTFAVTVHSTKDISSLIGTTGPALVQPLVAPLSLVAGDEQGRSLALGPPEKVTIAGHIQPDTVLGLPPMHVDWISPAGGGPPQILNVSVFPATFNTAYLFADTTNGGVNRSGTTSYTVATKETANEDVSYGVPGIANVSVQASQAATQLHQNTISKQYNTYQGLNTTFTTSTTFDDVVAATGSQFNIYSYRVLGQCVPANGPPSEGCPTGMGPLYIQFSGPDNVNYLEAAEGRNLEWYQPVQEPGNLFSYPATVAQLTANLGGGTGFQALTATDTLWDSQTSAAVKTNWTEGGGSNVSAGSTSTHTFDASVSASANVSFDGFGAGVGLGFDYNQSNSISTLNQATSSFSNSQGINLNRGIEGGGDVNSELYDYQGQTFIYGQTAPTGTVQTDATPTTTVQAQGYINAAHLVDMVSQSPGVTSGAFWVQAYNAAPDLALNHPQRWYQKIPGTVNDQQVQFNCPYGFTSSLSSPQCTAATPVSPAPEAIAGDLFYQMKGLFVTPGGTFNGPQITNTTLGSKVNLRARVYNYSLKNFPNTATLHVQFYAQPWGAGQFATGANTSTFAPAVFIGNGTTQLGATTLPLPQAFCGGFQSSSADPCVGSTTNNWEYVYATWDTSKGGVTANSTWKFWVVTWVENNGQLVSELSGHGLTSLPAANVQFNSLADVPIETYSNNLGFYNQVFTVLPAASQTNVAQTAGAANANNRATASKAMKHLAIGNLTTRDSAPIVRDVPITIVAPHLASGDHVDSIMSLYYDGDPSKGGALFDVQHISRVQLETPYIDTASYRATSCGQHQIFVRSIPLDGTAPVATATKTFKVTSDPVSFINDIIVYVNSPKYPPRFRNAILAYLNAAKRSFNNKQTQAGTIQMQVLLNLVQGGALFVPSDVQQKLANQMKDLLGCI